MTKSVVEASSRAVATVVLLLMIQLILVACGGGAIHKPIVQRPAAAAEISAERQQLLQITRDLLGTPYRFGGSSPNQGFDCSGLVHYSYRQLGVQVPRTVVLQRRLAATVAPLNLQPGDLLFFDTRAKNGHVGIYVGEGRFIHAPSSGGSVREERLDKTYWRQRWIGAGSLLGG